MRRADVRVIRANLDQLSSVRIRQWFNEDGLYSRENHGSCADANGDGEKGYSGESRSAAESAERVDEGGHLEELTNAAEARLQILAGRSA
jgi:hypothetical protein